MSSLSPTQFTLGVEEEYMVLDPVTRELISHEQRIVVEGKNFKRQSKGRNAPSGCRSRYRYL